MKNYRVGRGKIEILQGSITRYKADALVCPANCDLEIVAFSGSVQSAFLCDGGREIFEEAQKVAAEYFLANSQAKKSGSVPDFSAHITSAGRLPAKAVIHSVAVGIKNGESYCNLDVLAKSTKNVLTVARDHIFTSVGFPALGTGLYSVQLEEAVDAMSDEFERHLKERSTVRKIGLVLYTRQQYETGRQIFDKKFG